MKDARTLTDEELKSCVDGSTNLDMIREILTKHGVIDIEGWIDPEVFGDWFATGIQGFIDAEPNTAEWQEAYDNNWNWGYDIGDNINSYISDNFTDE
jgi:hypothetical protein